MPPLEAHVAHIPVRSASVPSNATDLAVVRTTPGARCTIVVTDKSGPSEAQGLDAKDADATGRAQWTGKVGTNTTPGIWPVDVACTVRSQKASSRGYLKVTWQSST